MKLLPTLALLCSTWLIVLPAALAAPTPEAATRDPHVLRKTSDGKVVYLLSETSISNAISGRPVFLLDTEGLDPLGRSALVQAILDGGAVRLMERDALGALVAGGPATAPDGEPAPVRDGGTFELSTRHLHVEAPDGVRQWAAPDKLFRFTVHRSPDPRVARQNLVEGADAEASLQCVVLRSISSATGELVSETLTCGEVNDSALEAMAAALLSSVTRSGNGCGGRARALQLPVEVARGDGTETLPADHKAYALFNRSMGQAGCQVMDIPPGALSGQGPYRYDTRAFDLPVAPTLVQGWLPATHVLQLRASEDTESAGKLVKRLEDMDPQLVDPDLVRKGEAEAVPRRVLELKVVDLETGLVLNAGRLEVGPDVPTTVVAEALAGMGLNRRPQTWVELRPIPETGLVKVDRRFESIAEGYGLVALSGGDHRAGLHLTEKGKAEAVAEFTTEGWGYGVLPLAAPFGTLTVKTTPEGATVTVDEQTWGPSPVSRTIGGGMHAIKASQEGCGEDSAEAEVLIGDETSRLLHLPGFIQAQVTPARAEILVNGEVIGKGEARVKVPYGDNTVTYRLDGYEDVIERVMVQSCQDAEVEHLFDGTIQVASTPPRSLVRLDGEDRARAPADLIVRPGEYLVSCHWCEVGASGAQVAVEPGATSQKDLVLPTTGPRASFGVYGAVRSGGEATAEIGADVEIWGNSKVGADLRLGIGGSGFRTVHAGVGGAYRLLAPAPMLNIPLGLRVDFLVDLDLLDSPAGGALGVAPAAFVEAHLCLGRLFTLQVGLEAGYDVLGRSPLVGLSVGLSGYTGSTWK